MTAYDLHTVNPYSEMELNKWNAVKLYNDSSVSVWYSSKIKPSLAEFYQVIRSAKPDIVYINGFYTNHFLYPLLLKKAGLLKGIEFIIAPRGMLQQGALQNKSFQKKAYLQILKLFGLMKNILFHVTTADEAKDIESVFGGRARTIVAGNIPKRPLSVINYPDKEKGKLKLIYLSIISEKKNLLLLLDSLLICNAPIVLDIYGPVKDENYWQDCLAVIKQLPTNITVTYKGDTAPDKVQSLLEEYDAKILLTKGENFGHALFESLSVGRPIITSFFTPWNELADKKAGWNVDIGNVESIGNLLASLADKDANEWKPFCDGALELANEYYQHQSFTNAYKQLFQ